MRSLLIVLLLISALAAQADYLTVYGNQWIKKEPNSSANRIKKVTEGELLILLDSGKQNRGYYHVQYPHSNIKGYIYRTLVKRISGNFPTFYDSTNAVEISIIDVGPGMSAYIKLPNGDVMVYDAGYNNRAYEYIKEKHPVNSDIEYLILSHTDADHWGSVNELAENYTLKNVIRTDYRKNKRSKTLDTGVAALIKNPPTEQDINLSISPMEHGTLLYDKDGVELYFMMGFGDIPTIEGWSKLNTSKKNNGVSIVVKLVYGNNSILFTGDAVGRNDGKEGCIASEKFMLDSLSAELLESNVLIAAHHGADNGSCMEFIKAVSPEYVVFSAGHKHHHPNLSTGTRFTKGYGLAVNNIYRTDKGDFEPGGKEPHQQEWNPTHNTQNNDIAMDDHIRIVLPLNGNIQIGYELED